MSGARHAGLGPVWCLLIGRAYLEEHGMYMYMANAGLLPSSGMETRASAVSMLWVQECTLLSARADG